MLLRITTKPERCLLTVVSSTREHQKWSTFNNIWPAGICTKSAQVYGVPIHLRQVTFALGRTAHKNRYIGNRNLSTFTNTQRMYSNLTMIR